MCYLTTKHFLTASAAVAFLNPVEQENQRQQEKRGKTETDEQEQERRDVLLSCVPSFFFSYDEAQAPSLISTQEISLERRWEDKRPKKRFCGRRRGREGDKRGRKAENGEEQRNKEADGGVLPFFFSNCHRREERQRFTPTSLLKIRRLAPNRRLM